LLRTFFNAQAAWVEKMQPIALACQRTEFKDVKETKELEGNLLINPLSPKLETTQVSINIRMD
jgi:hypothetical protein